MTLNIDFVRHGIAEERSLNISDFDRALTKKGIEKTEAIASRLHGWGWRWDVVLTSPLVRARQTAQLLAKAKLADTVETFEALAPGGEFEELVQWGRSRPEVTRIAVVGHQPDLSCWIELAVWGQASGKIQLKKAGIGRVEFPGGSARLGRGILLEVLSPKTVLSNW